jgi:hypothetical protein
VVSLTSVHTEPAAAAHDIIEQPQAVPAEQCQHATDGDPSTADQPPGSRTG